MPEEPTLKIKLKSNMTVDGVPRKAGDILEIREREALGMIGNGQAEELTEDQPLRKEDELTSPPSPTTKK